MHRGFRIWWKKHGTGRDETASAKAESSEHEAETPHEFRLVGNYDGVVTTVMASLPEWFPSLSGVWVLTSGPDDEHRTMMVQRCGPRSEDETLGNTALMSVRSFQVLPLRWWDRYCGLRE